MLELRGIYDTFSNGQMKILWNAATAKAFDVLLNEQCLQSLHIPGQIRTLHDIPSRLYQLGNLDASRLPIYRLMLNVHFSDAVFHTTTHVPPLTSDPTTAPLSADTATMPTKRSIIYSSNALHFRRNENNFNNIYLTTTPTLHAFYALLCSTDDMRFMYNDSLLQRFLDRTHSPPDCHGR